MRCFFSCILVLVLIATIGCATTVGDKTKEAYFNQGIANIKIGKYKRAIKDFNKAISLNPNYTNSYFYRGGAYSMKGNKSKALSDLSKAISLDSYYKDTAILNLYYMNLWGDEDFQKLVK